MLPLYSPEPNTPKAKIMINSNAKASRITVIRLSEPSTIGMGPIRITAPPELLNLPDLKSKIIEIRASTRPAERSETPTIDRYC